MRRVAITGMGLVSCLGHDLNSVADALRNGRSGVRLVPSRKELGFRSALAGTIDDFPMPELPRGFKRQLGLSAQMAVSASFRALEDARLDARELANERCGVIIGTIGNIDDCFYLPDQKLNQGRTLPAMAIARAMTSSASANLSTLFNIRGHCYTMSAACASGALAICEAFQLIAAGKQDALICGGVHADNPVIDILFEALRVFSAREDAPEKASRPFDRARDGLVPSGGCGMLVLEDYDRALSRGARIRAEVIGCGVASDGYHMTTPNGDGAVRAMHLALRDAGIGPEQVEYINAHATSTPVGDAAEARSILSVFGDRPFVSSTKSMTGHEVGAGGATEVIYTLLMMEHGFIAPSINIEEVSDDCTGIRIVANQAVAADFQTAVSNSSGFGGVNASLVLRKFI